MTIAEFKKAHNVESLRFYKSTHSERFVAAFGNDQLLITTVGFDPKKSSFVYGNPAGEDGASFILSNKEQKEADFSL